MAGMSGEVLKLSTVYTRMFNLISSSDHLTPKTGLGTALTITFSKAGAAFAAHDAAGTIAEVGNGVYSYQLTSTDTNTAGDFAWCVTAAATDQQTFVDQIVPHVLNDFNVDASGNVSIASSVKKNQALNGFMFLMTNSTSHSPQPGLTVTAQRSLAGAGFAPCANAVVELSNGIYTINLAAADTNAAVIMYRFTATGADDLDILILTQP